MTTVKKYLESLGFSSSTIESYYRDQLDYINWCSQKNIELEEASHNEVLGYVQYLKHKGLEQRSIAHQVSSIKHYYNWLIKRQIRADNPAKQINIRGIKKNSLYEILNHQELESLYTNCNQDKRSKIIVGLLIYQGLNGGEITNLELKDIQLREAKIYIKGGRRSNERTLAIKAHQIMDIMEYQLQIRNEILVKLKEPSDQFIIGEGRHYVKNALANIQKQLKQIQPKIKNLKQIRTSVITHWLKQYNLREVQYRAGHRYVSSTESYLINDMEGMQDAISLYHPDKL